jgi:hypothetical protein
MTLRAATLLALIGVSVRILWSLTMAARSLQPHAMPLLFRLAWLPTLLFEVALLIFFLTLYRKQSEPGRPD